MTDVPQTTPEGIPIPAFEPWRPRRERLNGWTADVQRAFISALTRIGCTNAAAKSVGKSRRSAYHLRDKEGAESFSAAWEAAICTGRDHARSVAISRALHGDIVPQFKNGRFTGYKTVQNDRLLIAAISTRRPYDAFGENYERTEREKLSAMRYRLEQWETALKVKEMALANGNLPEVGDVKGDEAWECHMIWRDELRREKTRLKRAEYRAAARRALAKAAPPPPRIRML